MQSRTRVILTNDYNRSSVCTFKVLKLFLFTGYIFMFTPRLTYLRAGQYQFLVNSTCLSDVLSVCPSAVGNHLHIFAIHWLDVNSHKIPLTYASSLQYSFQPRPSACKSLKSIEFLVLFRAGRVSSGQNFFGSAGRVGSKNMDRGSDAHCNSQRINNSLIISGFPGFHIFSDARLSRNNDTSYSYVNEFTGTSLAYTGRLNWNHPNR